jgi:hypothetical protein
MWNFSPMPLPIFTMWFSDTESIFFVYTVQRNTQLMWHTSQTVMHTKTMILWNLIPHSLGFIQTCCCYLQSRIPTFFFIVSPILLQSVRRHLAIALTVTYYWHVGDTSSDISPISAQSQLTDFGLWGSVRVLVKNLVARSVR